MDSSCIKTITNPKHVDTKVRGHCSRARQLGSMDGQAMKKFKITTEDAED